MTLFKDRFSSHAADYALYRPSYPSELASWLTPITAPDFAIKVSWPLAALVGYLGTWSAVRVIEKRIGRGPFDKVAAELAAVWGDPAMQRTIRWPLTILAGRCA